MIYIGLYGELVALTIREYLLEIELEDSIQDFFEKLASGDHSDEYIALNRNREKILKECIFLSNLQHICIAIAYTSLSIVLYNFLF